MLPSLLKLLELQKQTQKKIDNIRSKCPHPGDQVSKTYKSNTGNYDPSCNLYWIDFQCNRCGKVWSEDQ